MMTKALSSIEGVPYCFSRSSCQISRSHGKKKIVDFPRIGRFWTVTMRWCTKLEVAWKKWPIVFQGHLSNFKVKWDKKNNQFWSKLAISRQYLQLELTDGYGMMHKAWSSIEEAPCCFSRSSVKFQGHKEQQIANFDLNRAFLDCNSSFNSLMAFK